MTRPKGADSKQTVELILATALVLLDEKRQDGPPSLREVAKRAGVSVSAIRYYFDSKEELLEACLDGYYERLGKLTQDLMKSASPAPDADAVEAAARAFFRFCHAERGLVALRLRTNTKRGELHPRRQGYFMGTVPLAVAKILEPHVEVSAIDARFSVQALTSMIVRFALFSDSELENLSGLDGQDARDAAEDYTARAARRMLYPSKG